MITADNKSGNKIVFIHRTRFKNYLGEYETQSRIWDSNKKFFKINYFSKYYTIIQSDLIFPEDMKGSEK